MSIFCKDSANERRTCQACLSIYAECSLSSAKIRKILLWKARKDVKKSLIIDYGLNNVKITGDIPPGCRHVLMVCGRQCMACMKNHAHHAYSKKE